MADKQIDDTMKVRLSRMGDALRRASTQKQVAANAVSDTICFITESEYNDYSQGKQLYEVYVSGLANGDSDRGSDDENSDEIPSFNAAAAAGDSASEHESHIADSDGDESSSSSISGTSQSELAAMMAQRADFR